MAYADRGNVAVDAAAPKKVVAVFVRASRLVAVVVVREYGLHALDRAAAGLSRSRQRADQRPQHREDEFRRRRVNTLPQRVGVEN